MDKLLSLATAWFKLGTPAKMRVLVSASSGPVNSVQDEISPCGT